jgi:hypothetical protein
MNAFIAFSVFITFMFLLYHAPNTTLGEIAGTGEPEPVKEKIDWWKK